MEAGAHLKRPWDDDDHHLHSAGRMPGPIAMPGITSTTSYQLASPALHPPIDRRLPSITTALERQLHSPIDHQHSTFPKYQSLSQLPPRAYSPPEGPVKRPRLLYNPNHGPENINSTQSLPTNTQQEYGGAGSRQPDQFPFPHGHEEPGSSQWFQRCSNCSELKDLVQNVISGLVELGAEVREAMSGTNFGQSTKQEIETPSTTTDVGELGLRRSLMWAANNIVYSTRLVRDLSISRPLPPIPMAITTPGSAHPDLSNIDSAPNESLKRRLDLSEKERFEDFKKFCPPSSFEDHLPRTSDPPTSNMSSDGQRRGYGGEAQQPLPAHSPHRTVSSSGSAFGPPQSPMQAPPSSRMLPSPSSLHFPSSASQFPTMPSPPSASQSAQAAHLQDLQHQISTKTLALQTLQREHDSLLAAFSRQQTRCATLDKKSQVSDGEINSLAEEKIRLQSQVEALEAQVEELIKSRDEAHKQSVANGTQYMQIMSMSSRLQAQGAADMKRWKTEKDEWEKEKGDLTNRIQQLEAGSPTPSSVAPPFPSGPHASVEGKSTMTTEVRISGPPEADMILSSTSLDILRAEVIRLRKICHDMELTLQDLKTEANRIDQVMQDFATIGKRISTKADEGIQHFDSGPGHAGSKPAGNVGR